MQSQAIDGNKFMLNGMEIDYSCSQNCYEQFQGENSSNPFSVRDEETASELVVHSQQAFRDWQKSSIHRRIEAVERIVIQFEENKSDIVKILMWDTGKCKVQATLEVDQTVGAIEGVLQAFEIWCSQHKQNIKEKGNSSIGPVLCWPPETNSLLEAYKLLIPVLLTGNTAILKIPCAGGLVHIMTRRAVESTLPDHVLQFVLGAESELIQPLMSSGIVAMVAMVGSRNLANRLIRAHPQPRQLKLKLEPVDDIFAVLTSTADIESAARSIAESMCQHKIRDRKAVRLVMAHTSVVQAFLHKLTEMLTDSTKSPLAPPSLHRDRSPLLCSPPKPEHLQQLLIDALRKGAMVVNEHEGGGRLLPEFHGTRMQPAIVYPVNDTMQLWSTKSTVGPILAVASYEQVDEVCAYIAQAVPGMQTTIFTDPVHSTSKTWRCCGERVSKITESASNQHSEVVFNFLFPEDLGDDEITYEHYARLFETYTTQAQIEKKPYTMLPSPIVTGSYYSSGREREEEAQEGEREGWWETEKSVRMLSPSVSSPPISVHDDKSW